MEALFGTANPATMFFYGIVCSFFAALVWSYCKGGGSSNGPSS